MGSDGRAIVARGLTKRYDGRAVVHDLTFGVARGECLAVLGPNGAGKTTTVEILEGYRAPDTGSVEVLGLDPIRDARALKPRIGLMLQEGGLYPAIRPLEALEAFAGFCADPAEPKALLRLVGLETVARTPYRQLSGGQKQRLALALALIGRPELVFLDEPTTGLDPEARLATWQIVEELKATGVTVLLTTHLLDEAERLADRVAILDRGRLLALDTPAGLRRQGAAERITFTARPGLDLDGLAPALGADAAIEERPGSYLVTIEPTPRALAALAAWLADRDVLATSLAVGDRSLESVYLRLTGRKSEEDVGAEQR